MAHKNKQLVRMKSIFGVRMKQARELLKMPQEKLGVAIGLDANCASARISRYETGVHEPPIGTARLLAKALKVPLGYLYCADNDLAEILMVASKLTPLERAQLLMAMKAEQLELNFETAHTARVT